MPSQSQEARAKRLVIGVTGRIGAGKTSAGKYLSSRHGFQYLRYSQVLSEWLANDPETKADLQEVGWKVMAGGTQAELNRRLIAQITPDADIAVDGLRHPTDYDSLKDSFASAFHLLYIEASRDVRWKRLKEQGRYVRFEAFENSDLHSVEQQIEMLRANAALVLRNEGSLQDLYVVLDGAIRDIRKEGQA
jgi:dephospho-CoA kinase